MVWGGDALSAVPSHFLIALARNGGVVLGAYAGALIVGMLLGVPAIRQGRLEHLSHQLGVHPGWRGRRVGDALKWRQRELVLAQGIETITWTFDPLEAPNARLNIAHLGSIVRTYSRDYYGAMEDALNRGIPSDRFTVEWLLRSDRVRERAAGGRQDERLDAPLALTSMPGPDGMRKPGIFVEPTGPTAMVEIPVRVQEIKRQSHDDALAWRLAARDAFERLFALDYVVTGVVHRDDRVFYYLEKATL